MRTKLEYVLWPGELAAKTTEKLGATALGLIRSTYGLLDSRRLAQTLEANHVQNELDGIKRDNREKMKRGEPEVVRLNAKRIAEITKKDFLQRAQSDAWLSPDYIAQVAKNMADCDVPAETMAETIADTVKGQGSASAGPLVPTQPDRQEPTLFDLPKH